MKSNGTSKKFPVNSAEWAAVVQAAPGKSRRATAEETAQWNDAIVVNGGGYKAVREAVAADRVRRKQGERGAQIEPTKQLVSVRYSPEVLAFFRAGGAGWQTRMDEALKQWVTVHSQIG